MRALDGFSPVARSLLVGAAIAIIIVVLQWGSPLLSPILLALFIAVVATEPLRWLQRRGLPKWFALAVVFMLLEATGLPAKLKAAFHPGPETEERLRRAVRSINRYMVIKSLTSLATAALAFAWLWLLGVEFPVLWAIFAFVFNFVPFVGAVLMLIPPTLLALVQIDVATALLVAAGFVVINTMIGSIIEPRVMGRGLGVSTLAVFLSLLFWGWVFGTVGVVLSVPLTLAAIIALDANPQTRPLAILLGPDVRGAPAAGAPPDGPPQPPGAG